LSNLTNLHECSGGKSQLSNENNKKCIEPSDANGAVDDPLLSQNNQERLPPLTCNEEEQPNDAVSDTSSDSAESCATQSTLHHVSNVDEAGGKIQLQLSGVTSGTQPKAIELLSEASAFVQNQSKIEIEQSRNPLSAVVTHTELPSEWDNFFSTWDNP
jgi:hypothetical protein